MLYGMLLVEELQKVYYIHSEGAEFWGQHNNILLLSMH